jgi:hypothetical protein
MSGNFRSTGEELILASYLWRGAPVPHWVGRRYFGLGPQSTSIASSAPAAFFLA